SCIRLSLSNSTNQQYHQVLVEYQDLKRFRSSLVSVSPSTNIRDKVHLMRKTTGNNENDLPNQQTNYDDQNRSSCTNSINNLSLRKSSISQNFRNGRCRRNCASNHQSDTPDTTDDNNSNVTTKIVFHDRSQ
ncbi:unnamed protein product, partial [Rotaria magnacalcarata]